MRDSFTLPDNNVLLSFSGGRTSAYMLYKILEAHQFSLPDRCKVVFANTGREMPETYEFVQRCSDEWDVPVIWLEYDRVLNDCTNKYDQTYDVVNHNSASRQGEPFEKLIEKKGSLPDALQRWCTVELKVLTIKRYLRSLGWTHWINTIGIRADEQHRVKVSPEKFYDNWYPLVDAMQTKHHVMAFWKQHSFDLKVTPGFGNCDGCFLKSEKNIASLWRLHPERATWWMDLEERSHGKRNRHKSFFKNKTYKGIGDFVSRQGDWVFDTEGVLCQADDGECTGQ